MKLLISPHNDDEVLFSCWTLLREKPLVVVVFDSFIQPSRNIPGTSWFERRQETARACNILGVECRFLGLRDSDPPSSVAIRSAITGLADSIAAEEIFAPATEVDGHEQHNLVSDACVGLGVKEWYLTYTKAGKSTSARKVPYEPEWVGLKLKALAEYKSQFHPATGCAPHFIGRSLEEYYAG